MYKMMYIRMYTNNTARLDETQESRSYFLIILN